jgi:hypothetical protein
MLKNVKFPALSCHTLFGLRMPAYECRIGIGPQPATGGHARLLVGWQNLPRVTQVSAIEWKLLPAYTFCVLADISN